VKAIKSVLAWVGLPAILVGVWWATTLQGVNFFVPKPGAVLEKLVTVWFGQLFFSDVVPSLARLLVALVISIVLGIVAGLVIGSVRWLRWLSEPLLEFVRAIPATILIPILMLVIGINEQMKITVIVLGAVWPILLNTIGGVQSIDEVLSDTSRVYGIRGWARVRFLLLRGASPQIMAGVRQSLAIALILLVVSEMFAATEGIGHAIIVYQNRIAVPEMWAGILLLSLIGILLALGFQLAQRRVLRWYYGLKEASHGD